MQLELEKIKVILATNNENKIKEIEHILGKERFEFLNLKQIGFFEDILENGDSFCENALIKAKKIFQLNKKYWVIADDSGLEVPYLNNEPGIYSARYASNHDDKKNMEKLLNKLDDALGDDRCGRFVCAICCILDENTCFALEGEVWGRILREPKGENGFGYDPVMFYPEKNKTFAEMTFAEKNEISHRSDALRKLKIKIDSYLEGKDGNSGIK
ncbi:MAG: RdgB/HAM1 family non-canonical purine NTP pyrophosphatase [Oscillospiraceae bacterium]|nr:RdgB/HAM1 family non-canonical purine NTP pyrophosphatase [Oscillospiraceae bacterium]